jgi:hypothetical protein
MLIAKSPLKNKGLAGGVGLNPNIFLTRLFDTVDTEIH